MSAALLAPERHPIPLATAIEQIEKLKDKEVEERFARATLRTAEGLTEMAACVRVLESRGRDLSSLRMAILPYLRLIAHGQLAPEALLKFAASPYLLSAISRLPMDAQRHLIDSGMVRVAVVEADRSIGTREVDPRVLSHTEISRVFSSSGIVPPESQLTSKPRKQQRKRRVRVDAKARVMHVANAKIPLADVLAALAEAAGRQGDILDITGGPSVGAVVTQEEMDRLRAACKAMRLEEREFVRRAILSWLI
jgi:hypothetical protein